jgi:cystathionine beta-synthase
MDDAFFINQFGNPANPQAHEEGTGPEIWRQMDGNLDAIVLGVGSSGTVTGLSHYFKKEAPDVEIILADPEGSILEKYVNEGHLNAKSSSWLVEGIGEDFLPVISDFTHVTKAYAISDAESFKLGRELLNKEGILAGSSTGTLLAAALRYCQEQTKPKTVLTFAADTGNRYLSKMYNDYWMRDQGFLERVDVGDLRDLIARPYESHDTVTVGPDEPLSNAYTRMKLYDVSQLPVIEQDRIVGILDESDLLQTILGATENFGNAVSTAMTTELSYVNVDDPVETLLPIFDKDFVAIVKEGEKFLGLITRVDLLYYLRRRAEL